MRKTTFCMWPTVTRVSTGSEWRKPADGLGAGGGASVGLGERDSEGGLPREGDRGGTPGNTTPHTPSPYFHRLD